jgi:uncharacterized integral membrane protein (TIGR00698 family)
MQNITTNNPADQAASPKPDGESALPTRRRGVRAFRVNRHSFGALAPGLGLCLVLATVATLVGHKAPIVGGAVIAILLGILLRNTAGVSPRFSSGIRFSSKSVLQVAVALLGAGLNLGQVWTTGTASLAVLLGTLVLGIPLILLLSRLLGVDKTLGRLIAVGTGICGASAIGALAPILVADEDAIAYAIATVFMFNVAAVLVFPPIGHLFGFSAHGFGLWAGTAINDTSSVVAAGYSFSAAAGAYAVIVKLTRTLMIVPVSIIFAVLVARERLGHASGGGPPAVRARVPRFILWFVVASTLNTLGVFGSWGAHALPAFGQFLIVVALAGVGLSADLRAMVRTGVRPILVGLLGWLSVAGLSLVLQQLTGVR